VNVDDNRTIDVFLIKKTYSLTIEVVGQGTVTKNPDKVTYSHGDIVELTANPAQDWSFTGWSGDLSGSTNPVNITINGNRTVTATFIMINQYTITVSANPTVGGVVAGGGNYQHGDQVDLTATPNEGYEFVNWTENGTVVSDQANYSFTATKDRTLVANFRLKTYTIAATSGNGGSIDPAGNIKVKYGTDKEFTMNPDEGYEVDDVLVDDVSIGAVTFYKFENVTADHTIHVTFKIKTYTITLTASPTDGGTVDGGGSFKHGDEVTAVATPNEGKSFLNWTEDGIEASKDPVYKFTATKNRNLVANFRGNRPPEFDKLLPANGAVNQPVDVKLEWNAVDPDGAPVTYDVYFGYSSDNLSKILEGTNLKEYSPGVIKGFTLYWKVVASDGSATKDSGVMSFSTVGEVLTDKSIHMIDNFLDKQPADPVAIVVQVKGIGTISGSEIEIGIDTNYMKFLNADGQTLAEFLAANPGTTYEDFEPWCEYKATTASFLEIVKLKDATGNTVSLSGAYTNATGRSVADGNLWFVYVKTKDQTGKTIAVFSKVSFRDATLNEIPVDSTDQGLFIVK